MKMKRTPIYRLMRTLPGMNRLQKVTDKMSEQNRDQIRDQIREKTQVKSY